ncbi:UvrD-helicase domain-containing protein [Deinococcus oregonensis]|uniref:DNA 3'-5' helicase n=1 Tax=Deinococcus oregonensis TaxID=1805970 RepID=A0ABV6B0A9_9DEIO
MTYVTRQGETLRTTNARLRPIPAQFTPQQREFVEAVRSSGRHLVLRATAGSGKTTTLTEAAWHLGAGVKAVYFAYNKHSVTAVGPRLPAGIGASTLHAYGRRVLCGVRGPQLALDNDRSLRLAELVYGSEPVSRRQVRGAARMWDLAREYVLNEDAHEDDLAALAADAEWPENDGVAGLRRVLRAFRHRSLQDWHAGGLPDFTDFLWLPLELGLGRGTLGAALVDEAQDLTPLRQRFVTHLLGLERQRPEPGEDQEPLPRGRLIAVGDPEQAIYTYAGADPRGLWRLAERLGAQELPLSVSFRCPASHVALARNASEFIQASGMAQAGMVEHVAADLAHYGRGDVVLCRLNAPLLRLALLLMTRRISVNIRGRDLATRLETAAQEAFALPADEELIPDRIQALHERRARPLQFRADEGDRAAKKALGELNDLCSCLRLLALRAATLSGELGAGGKATLSGVSGVLRGLYREDADVLLSTVHRAKGLEWERVTLLYPEQMPAPYGDPEEERCVLFVALTRSQRELRLAYGQGAWESGWRLAAPEGWEPQGAESAAAPPLPPPVFSPPPSDALPPAPGLPAALALAALARPPRPFRRPVAPPPSPAALTDHALRVRALQAPATLEDLRPFALYSGQADLPVLVLAARLEALRQDSRAALAEWAGASLVLLRDVQSRSVHLDLPRLVQVERAANRARLAIPLMQPLTPKQVSAVVFEEHFARLRPAHIRRRGERNWQAELEGEAHAFDPRTGELLGTPFAPFAVHLRLER